MTAWGVSLRDQVGLARQRCRPAVEFEAVLCFDVHIKATVLPVCFSLVEERGVVQRPLGLVEVRWDLGPVLVVGLEPDGPFARVLAGQQPGQPGGPDVGGFSRDGHVCLGGVRLSQVYWHPQQRTTAICHQSGSEILPALRVWVFSSRPPAALGLKALAGVGNNRYARFCLGSSRHSGPALGDRSPWRRQHVVACFC